MVGSIKEIIESVNKMQESLDFLRDPSEEDDGAFLLRMARART